MKETNENQTEQTKQSKKQIINDNDKSPHERITTSTTKRNGHKRTAQTLRDMNEHDKHGRILKTIKQSRQNHHMQESENITEKNK